LAFCSSRKVANEWGFGLLKLPEEDTEAAEAFEELPEEDPEAAESSGKDGSRTKRMAAAALDNEVRDALPVQVSAGTRRRGERSLFGALAAFVM
jgi:hypothetical protein